MARSDEREIEKIITTFRNILLKAVMFVGVFEGETMAKHVFISHSTKDKQWADQLCSSLETVGISCWIAPRDIQPGQSWAGHESCGCHGYGTLRMAAPA